ncbi:protein ImuB [Polymorphobacter multimanifer]|uniref:Protein ImuB n=1 Tax=Polymorphobacter multimanifer TaxID=1070431 RepID=A0A841LG28_9SPHN|nr:protein ImuB [Polymorphobacter multimanifer]
MRNTASGRRILAVLLPGLPAERVRQAAPSLPDTPLALTVTSGNAVRLAALDSHAAAAGLAVGMTLADARALLPELQVQAHDPAADLALLEALADGCGRYTPMVAVAPPAGLLLDITGAAHLAGGEAALAGDLLKRLARMGLSGRAALADNPAAALALAGFADSDGTEWDGDGLVAQADGPSAVLALPIAALLGPLVAVPGLELDNPDALALALRRAGLRSVALVAGQPRAALAARLGDALVHRLDVLLGAAAFPLQPRWPEPEILVEARFAQPLLTVPAALKVVEGLVVRACLNLSERGAGGRAFEALLYRADGALARVRVDTAAAQRAPAAIMRLFGERLAALNDPLDPGFGYDLVRLAVPVLAPLGEEQLALDGGALAAGELLGLVDRLTARLGPGRVRRLAGADSHVPEQAGFDLPFTARPDATAWAAQAPGEPPERPALLFDPPQPVEVMAEVPDGPPRRFRWHRRLHDIVRAEGPERIAAEWWRRADGQGLTRDYYRVEDSSGGRFWLFRHGLYEERRIPGWFVHGRFA